MGAIALACGHFGRRAAVAVNLALHPDEAGWGRVWWPIWVLARHGPRGSYSGSTQGRDTHRFTQSLARWNKTGNQSVLRFSPPQVERGRYRSGPGTSNPFKPEAAESGAVAAPTSGRSLGASWTTEAVLSSTPARSSPVIAGGLWKLPRSNRLYQMQNSVPSQYKIFNKSPRRLMNLQTDGPRSVPAGAPLRSARSTREALPHVGRFFGEVDLGMHGWGKHLIPPLRRPPARRSPPGCGPRWSDQNCRKPNDMAARMNDFDRPRQGKRKTHANESGVAFLVAATTSRPACPSIPSRSGLAAITPAQRSSPPMQAVLGESFPLAEPPRSQSACLKSPNHPSPIPLLRRIARLRHLCNPRRVGEILESQRFQDTTRRKMQLVARGPRVARTRPVPEWRARASAEPSDGEVTNPSCGRGTSAGSRPASPGPPGFREPRRAPQSRRARRS